LLTTEITGKEEADIEDFFHPSLFVDIVNAAYDLDGKHTLTVEKLMAEQPDTTRIVKKAEAYFRTLPEKYPTYSHYEPALWLLQHPEILEGKENTKAETLSRFETAFKRINQFVV
jgi:hypothetical protein